MKSRQIQIIIQSRLSSSRLPAKALLPVSGYPAVVLCALRAANSGLPVLVATSDHSSDDHLVRILEAFNISFIRGSLDDVLGRFVTASNELDEEDIIVRLTGDNLFPDGAFIELLINDFLSRGCEYLGTHSPLDGLPYGMSAEVFSAGVLRCAHMNAGSRDDREHVTPWIRKNGISELFRMNNLDNGLARLRCTLDDFDDYVRILDVFSGIEEPVTESWMNLVERLSVLPGTPKFLCPFIRHADGRIESELVLGTVQLGMTYGIANRTGQPDLSESARLVSMALSSGVNVIDTARAYGQAEERLGKILTDAQRSRMRIVTKLDPMAEMPEKAPGLHLRNAVDASVYRSCRELNTRKLDVLMLHRWAHAGLGEGAVWGRLIELRNEGVIEKLGASVYSPEEAIDALFKPDVAVIQIPCNLLDWRWRKREFQEAILARPDVIIHARSVFLQGLMFLQAEKWPPVTGLNAADLLNRLDDLVIELNRRSRADLCIAYVRGQSWVSGLVLGMETITQLEENLELFSSMPLNAGECNIVDKRLEKVPEVLLNPARWGEIE